MSALGLEALRRRNNDWKPQDSDSAGSSDRGDGLERSGGSSILKEESLQRNLHAWMGIKARSSRSFLGERA